MERINASMTSIRARSRLHRQCIYKRDSQMAECEYYGTNQSIYKIHSLSLAAGQRQHPLTAVRGPLTSPRVNFPLLQRARTIDILPRRNDEEWYCFLPYYVHVVNFATHQRSQKNFEGRWQAEGQPKTKTKQHKNSPTPRPLDRLRTLLDCGERFQARRRIAALRRARPDITIEIR
jgi:hypothetical protein